MSDTTITAEERAEWRERLTSKFSCFDTELGGFTLRLLDALEQAEDQRKKDLAHCKFEFDRADKAEAENARLRERLESALDKIADIQENGEEEGACHACGICAGCPEDWQPTDDHNCRVMLELWADGEPLPWEDARRVVADAESPENMNKENFQKLYLCDWDEALRREDAARYPEERRAVADSEVKG